MDWVSALLGLGLGALGGGAASGSSQQDIKKTSSLTPEQQEIASALGRLILENIGRPLPAYTGQLTAGPTPLQQRSAATLADLIGQPLYSNLPAVPTYTPSQVATGAVEPAFMRLLQGQPAYEVTPQAAEQFYQTAIEQPALRTWREELLPSIREDFVGTGNFWSTSRQRTEQNAAANLAGQLAAQRGQIMYDEEQARRQALENAAQRAAGVLPAAASYALTSAMQPVQAGLETRGQLAQEQLQERQTWLDVLQQAFGVGTTMQQLEQAGLTAEQNEWLRQQVSSSPYLQMALQFLGVPMIAAYQPPYQPSAWAQALALLGQVATGAAQGGAFNNLFSRS